MKKILKSTLLLMMGMGLFVACETDNDSNPTVQTPTQFTVNTPVFANTLVDLANSSNIDLTWSQPNYGFPLVAKYDVEVSTSQDMANAQVVQTASGDPKASVDAALLASTLTNMLLESGHTEDEFPMEIPVYFRVKAYVQTTASEVVENTTILSNVVALNKVRLLFSLPPVATPEQLYLIGEFCNWEWSKSLKMVQCYDGANVFWHMVYIGEGGIKFNIEQAWDGSEVGFAGLHSVTGDLAGEIIDSGGNIASSTPGWYLMIVTCNVEGRNVNYDVQFNKPEVWLMGTVTPTQSWSELEDGCMFTVPAAADGEFVSPAFANDAAADSGVRAYVKVPGFDWWKTEFMVFDKKIVYRGMGGDQERVTATAGQKLYLNFTTETGEIK